MGTRRVSALSHYRVRNLDPEVNENETRICAEGDDDGRILRSWTWELRYARSTTQTVADQYTTTYFCVNFPPKLRKRIADTIHGLEALAKNPLFMDTLIIDEMIAFYRDAIKSHRTQLLAMVCGTPLQVSRES